MGLRQNVHIPSFIGWALIFLAMLEVMQSYSQQELDVFRQTARKILGKTV